MGSRCHSVHVEQYKVVIGSEPLFQRRFCPWSCRSWFGWAFIVVFVLSSLTIFLMVGIQVGSRDPRTELQAMTIHSFNLTNDGSDLITPWVAHGNFTVTFQARNPSTVVGFRHKYLFTLVSAFYEDALWARSHLPRFSQRHKSSSNVTAKLLVDNLRINQSSGWALQSGIQNQSSMVLRVKVDARVRQKSELSIGQEARWFNLTCLVTVGVPTMSEDGRMLGKICSRSVESSKD